MDTFLQEWNSFQHLWLPVGVKVVLAILCGGIIGMERQRKHKPAGLRTNILICLGSALYTLLSVLVAEDVLAAREGGFGPDPGRIAAQIVTGIGFLGGGMIIQSRGNVTGLTSAATVWVVAAIGLGIGLGYHIMAIIFTITVYLTLSFLSLIDHKIFGKMHAYELSVGLLDPQARPLAVKAFQYLDLEILDIKVREQRGQSTLEVRYYCSEQRHKRIAATLWSIQGVGEINLVSSTSK